MVEASLNGGGAVTGNGNASANGGGNLAANGGGNGGGVTVLNGGGAPATVDQTPVPMGGILEDPVDAGSFMTFTGGKFRDAQWDPHLLAQVVLADFGGSGWQSKVTVDPPNYGDEFGEINVLLKKRGQRASRGAEIVAQALNLELYWADLLMVGAYGRQNTAALIAVGIAVGQMVGMHFKHLHKRARPVQVFPALMPVIITPSHPSYPNNHMLQSLLVANAVGAVFEEPVRTAMLAPLLAMAERIGENREIAGVHFPSDKAASRTLANQTFDLLAKVPAFISLCDAAKPEWEGITVGGHPSNTNADGIVKATQGAGDKT